MSRATSLALHLTQNREADSQAFGERRYLCIRAGFLGPEIIAGKGYDLKSLAGEAAVELVELLVVASRLSSFRSDVHNEVRFFTLAFKQECKIIYYHGRGRQADSTLNELIGIFFPLASSTSKSNIELDAIFSVDALEYSTRLMPPE